jgi:phospholipid-binding lipoprotein MlaA
MRVSRRRIQILLSSVVVLQTAAAPAFAQTEPRDPWEPFNRKMYAIHMVLDRHIFGPLARSFGRLPAEIRTPLTNFSSNLSEPVVFANDVLQAHPTSAATTLGRFVMNSTVGLAGFLDPASHNHMHHHDNGFGTTLGRWGVGPGPYMFIPFIGPSDVRDTIGGVGNIFMSPLYYARFDGKLPLTMGTGLINGLKVRLDADAALANIDQTSTDPYASLRSYFMQNRAAAIRGTTAEPGPLPEFDVPTDNGGAAPPTAPDESAAPPPPGPAEAGAPPSVTGTPKNAPGAVSQPPPPEPSTAPPPPASAPKWLIAPDADGPLCTAGGK